MVVNGSELHVCSLSAETTWEELYGLLRSLAKHLVYSFDVPSWHGQEHDLIEDIVQETLRRLLERAHRAECGQVPHIHSVKSMIMVIARNYCSDVRRHDRRFVRGLGASSSDAAAVMDHVDQPSEVATENVYRLSLFLLLTHEIAHFPAKQRRALLMDLANRMHFDAELTPLQAAFLAIGIDLQEYQQPLPDTLVERTRHLSLLSHAYKRVACLSCVQQHISAPRSIEDAK